MITLSIDSSGPYLSAGISNENLGIKTKISRSPGSHFEDISAIVTDLLNSHGVTEKEVTQIIVGGGPGSFTGLRISLGFASGFAWAGKIPIAMTSSFFAAASLLSHVNGNDLRCVIGDARRNELYFGVYDFSFPETPKVITEPEIISVDDFLERSKDLGSRIITAEPAVKEIRGLNDLKIEEVEDIARGLLSLQSGIVWEPFSPDKLAFLEPMYTRQVAAKTIEERRGWGA